MFTAKFAFQEREQAGTGVASTLKCEIGSRRLAPGGTVTWIAWLRSVRPRENQADDPSARRRGEPALARGLSSSLLFFFFFFFPSMKNYPLYSPIFIPSAPTGERYWDSACNSAGTNRLGTLTRYPPVVSIRRDAHLSRYLHERVANSTRISSEDRLFFNVKMKIGSNRWALLFSCWFTWYRWFCIVIYFMII